MRRWAAAVLVVVALLLLTVGTASGRQQGIIVVRDPAGDAKAAGLTKAERNAIDIVSLKIVSETKTGLLVVATYKGNFQKAFGHGHLKKAAALLVLQPRAGSGKVSAGLVSENVDRWRTFRETRSTTVGSGRVGNKLVFVVLGPGVDSVGSISLETIAHVPSPLFGPQPGGTVGPGVPELSPDVWSRLTSQPASDSALVRAPTSGFGACFAATPGSTQMELLIGTQGQVLGDAGFSQIVSNAIRSFKQNCAATEPPPPPPPPTTTGGGVFAWSLYSSNEVAGSGHFTGAATTFNGVKIVLPSGFVITNHLCPSQLQSATINGNTITCGGGSLSTGQTFTLNLQTSPFPTTGMGGQLFGETNGGELGPFTITGP